MNNLNTTFKYTALTKEVNKAHITRKLYLTSYENQIKNRKF